MRSRSKSLPTNRKVVLVGGCFDLIHYGHTQFLMQARRLGNYLIVALESDENVARRKGKTRPIHPQIQRAKMLLSIRSVDEVILLPEMKTDFEYESLIMNLKPEVIALTSGDPYMRQKRKQADAIGARMAVIPKVHTPSTSQLAKLIGLE